MEVGKYWVSFKKDFDTKYFDYIANRNVKQICSLSTDDFFGSPHSVLYGNDMSIIKMIVDTMLSRVFQKQLSKKSSIYEISTNSNKHQCPYCYSEVHIEIDMEEIVTAERQFISDFISKHIAGTKSIHQPKHIVVIHNAQSMSEGSILALRKPLEQFSNNIIFIFTTQNISRLDGTLKSRCMQIRCNTDNEKMETFFEFFIEENMISGDQFEIDPYDGIINNLLKLSSSVPNSIECKLHAFIDKLLVEKNVFNAYEHVRNFGYKMLHFNVPFAIFMKITIKYLSKTPKYKKFMYDIAVLSADLELKSQNVSKQILIFENYYMEIYKKLVIKK